MTSHIELKLSLPAGQARTSRIPGTGLQPVSPRALPTEGPQKTQPSPTQPLAVLPC